MTVKSEESNPQNLKLDARFITTIKGRDFVLYAGVLDMAHRKGLKRIIVEAVQLPNPDNGYQAICKATVESPDGQEFIELGDADKTNVNKMISDHIIRMAATRAKARALRDYVNVGMTALEELGDLDQVVADESKKSAPKIKQSPVKSTPKKDSKTDEGTKKSDSSKEETKKKTDSTAEKESEQDQSKVSTLLGRGAKMSSAQMNAIRNLAQRRGISEEALDAMVEEAFNSSLEALSSSEASSFIRQLQQAA